MKLSSGVTIASALLFLLFLGPPEARGEAWQPLPDGVGDKLEVLVEGSLPERRFTLRNAHGQRASGFLRVAGRSNRALHYFPFQLAPGGTKHLPHWKTRVGKVELRATNVSLGGTSVPTAATVPEGVPPFSDAYIEEKSQRTRLRFRRGELASREVSKRAGCRRQIALYEKYLEKYRKRSRDQGPGSRDPMAKKWLATTLGTLQKRRVLLREECDYDAEAP